MGAEGNVGSCVEIESKLELEEGNHREGTCSRGLKCGQAGHTWDEEHQTGIRKEEHSVIRGWGREVGLWFLEFIINKISLWC